MQLSILGVCAILAMGARTAVIKQRRDTVAAKINWFRSLGCDDLVGEGSATLTEVLAGKTDGDCVAVSASSRPMRSIKVTDLYKTCTVTMYADQNCSMGATTARKGFCVSRNPEWRSISIDNCPAP